MVKRNNTLKKINNPVRYSQENPFIYESNYFYDYFRVIPFIRLKKFLDKKRINLDNKSILIPSCGCGIDAHYLKKYYQFKKIYFTDIHMRAAEKTRSNFYNEPFILSDNHRIAFKDNSIDYVFIAASLHHLKEPIRGLYELLRVARLGIIVIEPNDSWLTALFVKLGWAHEYEVEHGNYVYRFSKRDIDKISKALFFKYNATCFFAIHCLAKTKIEFLALKILNAIANCLCSSFGNYILFFIRKQ